MTGINPIPSLDAGMNRYDPDEWQKADGWTNGDPFNNGWRANHVTFDNGIMTLQLDNAGCPQACSSRPYASGEYRTNEFYGYGLLQGRFRAAQGDGTVSSLFFYTGSSDNNPWDEIDIEILGKDTNKMQINYVTNGVRAYPGEAPMIDLGFDASQAFHDYAILWTENSISWYVDGKLVHTEDGSMGRLPSTPGKVMANLWPGIGVDSWLNPFRYSGPVRAEYDWIRFTPIDRLALTGGQPPAAIPSTALPSPPPPPSLGLPNCATFPPALQPAMLAAGKCERTPTPAPAGVGRSVLYVADPEMGIMREDGRAELRLLDIADKVDLLPEDKQLEEMLLALTDPGIPNNRVISPDISWRNLDEFHRRYPELGKIQEIDQRNYYKFYRYFFDTRTYWDNAITLLSVYVQKCLEKNQLDKMKGALDMVEVFRARIEAQEMADQASPLRISCSPSSYKLAQLGLVEAEIRSQIQSDDVFYYLAGIDTTLNSIATMLSLQYNTEYPSAPDYFGLAKGILTLGNLYMQIANLTKEEKYFEAAHQLFGTLAVLEMNPSQSMGLHIDLSRLFKDPLFLENEKIDFIPDPYELSPSYYEINAEPEDVHQALKFNLKQTYILPEDIGNAQTGIFHYLKGVALISEANLFLAWPRVKKMDEILDQIGNINRGIDELRIAAQSSRQGEEKIRYYVNAAKVIKGNFFLALADRITFYGENPGFLGSSAPVAEIWERLIVLPEISPALSYYLPEDLPFGDTRVSKFDFSSFGDRRDEIWTTLVNAGYLSGNPSEYDVKELRIEKLNRKLEVFLQEHLSKYKYENGSLIIKGRMTTEEKTALLACFTRQEDKAGIEKLFLLTTEGVILFEGKKEDLILPASVSEEEKNKIFNILRNALSEVNYKRSVALIKAARDLYFTEIPEDLKYLHAWTQDKLLEIKIRLAEYIDEDAPQGKVADAAQMLAFSEQLEPLVQELARRNPATEYLDIEFNYLHTIPLLLGKVFPTGDKCLGKTFPGKICYETETGPFNSTVIKTENQSYRTLEVFEQLENEIMSLPPASKTYYEVYIDLKKVVALVQIYYDLLDNKYRGKTESEKVILVDYLLKQIARDVLSPEQQAKFNNLTNDLFSIKDHLRQGVLGREDKNKLDEITRGILCLETGREISAAGVETNLKNMIMECALKLLRAVERETAPAIPSYLWINLTRTLPDLLDKEHLSDREKTKMKVEIPRALIRFIFGTSENIQTNRKLEQFMQQHSSKYRYEDGMLMVNGEMTVEERNALLACFTQEADKDKIEQLFRRSLGAREFPPSLIEKILALKTELNKGRVDREACKNILNQIKEEIEQLNSSNQYFMENDVEIAAWDIHSLYAELYHAFTLVYGNLSHGRAQNSPEGSAFWQYAQSTYLESTWSYSPYDRNDRPFFLYELVGLPKEDDIEELAEVRERMEE